MEKKSKKDLIIIYLKPGCGKQKRQNKINKYLTSLYFTRY